VVKSVQNLAQAMGEGEKMGDHKVTANCKTGGDRLRGEGFISPVLPTSFGIDGTISPINPQSGKLPILIFSVLSGDRLAWRRTCA